MQTDHSRAISGLGIAVIIISAVTLVCCIIGWVFVTMGGSLFNQYGPSGIEEAMRDSAYGNQYYYYDQSISTEDLMSLGNLGLIVGGAALIWEALMCLVSLIAGILAMKNAAKPNKLGAVFGWCLAGAICAFLSGRIITMVLLIIMAVFASKDKNAAVQAAIQGAPMGQPVQGAQPMAQQQAYGQPMAQQQPVTYDQAPQQDQGFGQPVAPGQQVFGQNPAQPMPQVQPIQPAYAQNDQTAPQQPGGNPPQQQ